jgi:hypothetical protein
VPIEVNESTIMAAVALQKAYDRRANLPHWPATLLDTLMHPVFGRLLLLELQHPITLPATYAREPVLRPDPPPEDFSVSQRVTKRGSAPVTKRDLDGKSLAAGERPDD